MCRILNVALDLRGKKRPLDNVFADYACSVQGAPRPPLTCEAGEWPHQAGRPCGDP